MRWLLMLIILVEVRMSIASAGEALWVVRDAPAHGLVVSQVNLQPFIERSAVPSVTAFTLPDKKPVPVQFVPDGVGGEGVLVAQLPGAGDWKVQLQIEASGKSTAKPAGVVSTEHYEMLFTDSRKAGYPSAILFRATGKRLETFVWNDRVHHRTLGSFHLRFDPDARAEVVSDGEICTVVRVRARYCQQDGKLPPSEPRAVYHWFLFKRLPLVYVTARVEQKQPFAWDEFHFLEFNFPDTSLTRWAGGEPIRQEPLVADGGTVRFNQWGALLNEQNAIGMWGQPLIIHDGRGAYGTYLHSTWQGWDTTGLQVSTWLWVGTAENPVNAVRQASQTYGLPVSTVITTPALRQRIEAFRQKASSLRGRARQSSLWVAALAERREAQGDFAGAERMLSGQMPAGWHRFSAGEMGVLIEQTDEGIHLQSLYDLLRERELLAADNPPLFTLSLRDTETRDLLALTADRGWQKVAVERRRDGFVLNWSQPRDERFAGIRVTAQVRTDSRQHALRWNLQVHNASKRWSLWRVIFPEVAIAELGDDATVLFPRGPGEIQQDVWRRNFGYRSTYPNGWCSMQLLAVYAQRPRPVGLYFALHDPMGSTKDIGVQSNPAGRSVRLFYDHPVPNMGKAGNSFTLSGQAVWQLLRGDWYDAARIYRRWVMQEARWYPRSSNTSPRLGNVSAWTAPRPLKTFREWIRDLPAWSLASGGAQEVVPPVEEFAKYCGVPVGFHWYYWHQIPFDNDYPHYFPVKEGFADGVKRLQEAGVFVMPYINGRLWDTRDKGMEDFQFSAVAKPAATKDENGNPYTEVYGSKEADGSPVRLAVMCPTTELWQNKVREIVMRLFSEYGVDAVYIDQVAAAPPVLCFDASHGHPLGGGHWWNEGYWRMLDRLRSEMPAEHALTTECNAEPFIAWFDGYLTWHWQHEGQVPVFPAVYSQAIQMFGRAYRGGSTKDLALRMKAAQQLTFGEQIGWIDPDIIREQSNARFLKQIVQLRWRYRDFFTRGEMARPPRLEGNIPTVRADWQWEGEWWVSAPAVYTGAWKLPEKKRLVLFFINVAEEPVTATMRFHPSSYGIRAKQIRLVQKRGESDPGERQTVFSRFERRLDILPHEAVVWEIEW
ncbi:MAG: hypothetical protein KatS3mg022_1557 [Armatimonadota bacterium]|nr:MAG: hypothetical protein KatS3mg022_1557 [Armatimonadota bacterium]